MTGLDERSPDQEWFLKRTAGTQYAADHNGWGPSARYFRSRIHLIDQCLQVTTGDLLDVGCGPGALVEHLLDSRPGAFAITACDVSAEMLHAARARLWGRPGSRDVRLSLASIEELPFRSASFDVVIAAGVLEYVDIDRALPELARVVRPGGLVIVTMLNQVSPYHLFEWWIYWPLLRQIPRLQALIGVPPGRRRGSPAKGFRTAVRRRLVNALRASGLQDEDVAYYDLNALVPPLDQIVRRWTTRWRSRPGTTISRGPRRHLGTAYLVAARPS
ncbi:class I SAM-dependent methyltransferase [Kribbella sp. NPDC000426]|uniref:class I SAM-dependent methyltransferase n=1 Tax=Kribbella sp. NPDC000426 TaxID=3154255 RepID=UPI00332DF1C0